MKTQRLMNVSSANRKCRFTNIRQTAFVTVWFGSCGADGTAVIDEAVAEAVSLFRWNEFPEFHFYFLGIFDPIY